MGYIKNFFKHLHTVNRHRFYVCKYCFKCGLYKQGLIHDLSKYSPTEFFSSVKYYQGNRSPIDKEKETIGYSLCWLHHKGRNKHHFEFWFDMNMDHKAFEQIEMPFNYLLESVCDRVAASRIYNKKNYYDNISYEFLVNGPSKYVMNEKTFEDLKYLLKYLTDHGEKEAFKYYKSLYKQFKKTGKVELKKAN